MLAPSNPCTPVTCDLIVTSIRWPPHNTALSEACELEVATLFGGVLEEGAYPLARRLFRSRMIEETIRSQAPNKVLMATPPPIDQAEILLQRSCSSALSQLCSGHCSRLMSYRHSVSWADDLICPDCRSTDQLRLNILTWNRMNKKIQ